MSNTETKTRTVLRYPLDDRDLEGVATVKVGPNPKIVHVGTGTSSRICAWVEVDAVAEEITDGEELRFAFIGTGQDVPADSTYLNFTFEAGPTGLAIRHVYLVGA